MYKAEKTKGKYHVDWEKGQGHPFIGDQAFNTNILRLLDVDGKDLQAVNVLSGLGNFG